MFKTIVKISTVLAVAGVVTGCASAHKHEEMHSKLSALESRLNSVEQTSQQALAEARGAHEHFHQLEKQTAENASQLEAINAKLDRLFHKSMMK